MNELPLIRHLLRKDIRNQRGWLAFYWLLALLIPLYAFLLRSNSSITVLPLFGPVSGFDFILGLVLIRIILLDPPGRTVHFLATRPISWRPLFVEKIIFAFAFLLIPMWIAKLGTVYCVGIPYNGLDAILYVIETSLLTGATMSVVVLFSMFQRSLPGVCLSLVVFTILLFFGAMIWAEYSLRKGVILRGDDVSLNNCLWLILSACFIVTIGVSALVRYRTKSFILPVVTTAAGLAISLVIISWNPSLRFSDHSKKSGDLPSLIRDQLHLVLTSDNIISNKYLNGGTWNGIKYYDLNHTAELEGLESPYYATLVDYHAEATLRSGHVIKSSYNDTVLHGLGGSLTNLMAQQIAGLKPDSSFNWNEKTFEIFNFRPDQSPGEDLSGASLKGVMTIEIRRASILKEMPLKSGETALLPRQRYTLKQVSFGLKTVDFFITWEGAPLALRDDGAIGSDWRNLPLLVMNRKKNESLVPGGNSMNSGFGAAFYQESYSHYDYGPGGFRRELAPDWPDDAELCLFSSESCGRINFPYELTNVDLTPK